MYLSQTLLVFWLFKNSFGFASLIFYYLFSYLVALLGIIFLPKIQMNVKKAMFYGILLSAFSVLVLIKLPLPYFQMILSAIFSGLNVIFFWIPYNTMFFKFSSEDKRGANCGMYYLITPIVGITLQPLTGIIAEKFGFQPMFLFGIFFYLIPLFILKFLPDYIWQLDIKEVLSKIKFDFSLLLQGATSRINYSLISIFSLFFLTTPKQIGNFFGYLAIVAAIVSVFNGYISDKIKNKKYFFYFFSSLAVLSFVPLAFARNPYSWSILAGISSLCIYLANPFWFTYSLDKYKDFGVEKSMALREVFLNSGYIFNLLVVFLVFNFTGSSKISLLIICVICCLLPIVSYLQKVYINKNA